MLERKAVTNFARLTGTLSGRNLVGGTQLRAAMIAEKKRAD